MYEVVWPRGKRVEKPTALARRLETLEGKTVGALWNWAFLGNKVFPLVEKELRSRYRIAKFVSYDAFGPIHGNKQAQTMASLESKLRQQGCDAVVAGMGC